MFSQYFFRFINDVKMLVKVFVIKFYKFTTDWRGVTRSAWLLLTVMFFNLLR